MPDNTAAWLTAKYARLQVKPAPYPTAPEHGIVVRARAVAINPVDRIKQVMGDVMFSWIKYPTVLGSDVAGDVVAVGAGVSRFKVGERVLGHALGMSKARNTAAEGAFQAYTVLLDHMSAPIPDALSYEAAAVLPLGLSTAACGLFQKDHLALDYPSHDPKPTGETLLVWGGSTSVGANAIQLAVAAGYEVIATASPHNFDYVKRLGASQAFDYHGADVVQAITAALGGKTIAGAIAIGSGSAEACLDIVRRCKGRKFVSMASPSVSFDHMSANSVSGEPVSGGGFLRQLLPVMGQLIRFNLTVTTKSRIGGVRTKFIFGDTLADNAVGRIVYVDFLPRALAEGRYVAAPDPLIVGHGLDQVQTGFDIHMAGVSARKVVVSL